jgi:hypothetical protein
MQVVLLHSGGGLLVTVIMKYADNIAKTIAVAISLVVSTGNYKKMKKNCYFFPSISLVVSTELHPELN